MEEGMGSQRMLRAQVKIGLKVTFHEFRAVQLG